MASSGKCSVLVVDDDRDIRTSVTEALDAEGYEVLTASDGKHALHMLKDEHVRPDVILLDLMMPEMDGWAFRTEQQKDPELASIPVVLFTAYDFPMDTINQLRAAGFLKKPLRLNDLLSSIGRVLPGIRH